MDRSTTSSLSARGRARLQRALLRWFRAEQRDLPWRATRDPYAVWISEAMLQQTRVETVVAYYLRFLERFPTVRDLAAAEEGEVLALWSGLGYYARARALRTAARAIVARHGGELPRRREQWLELPGVGPYTAGAVLSIAFGESEPLVDGNVERVLARLFALEEPAGSTGLRAACWELARALVPGSGERADPGQWNQALMELGARVCTPRAPECPRCPVRALCAALARGTERELPRARARRSTLEVRLEILVPRRGAELLLVERSARGRMAGLLEFPTRELAAPGAAPHLWPAGFALALEPREELGELSHAITHHRIRATVRGARCRRARAPARWVREEELGSLALTGLARKVHGLVRVPGSP